jgi:hypothetical protein
LNFFIPICKIIGQFWNLSKKNTHTPLWVTADRAYHRRLWRQHVWPSAHGGKATANGRLQGVGPAAPYHHAPNAIIVGHGDRA